MKPTAIFIVVGLSLLVTGYAQEQADTYIESLQMPCYPPLARQARVQGNVKVKIAVHKDGTVASAELIDGHPLLREAAVNNVKTWKFGTGNREPLRLATTVIFEYKLADERGRERCAARVMFDSFNKVTVVGHVPPASDDATAK